MTSELLLSGWRGLVVPLGVIAVWGMVAGLGLGNAHIFVPLDQIGVAAARLSEDGTLGVAVVGTVTRMLLGFTIGASFGLVFGIVLGLFTPMNRTVSPTFHGLRQIAIFAWMPLLTAWVGSGSAAMVALIALAAFFPMAVNVEAGCRNVPQPYLEIGRVYELSTFQVIWRIVLPAAFPAIVAGLELSLAGAWVSTVGAEYLIAAGDGVGVMLAGARISGDMDVVIVAILLLGVIGFALHRLVASLSRRTQKWRLA